METEHTADLPRAARAMREFLTALGVDIAAQGMEETPQRVAQLYAELFAGQQEDTAGSGAGEEICGKIDCGVTGQST